MACKAEPGAAMAGHGVERVCRTERRAGKGAGELLGGKDGDEENTKGEADGAI